MHSTTKQSSGLGALRVNSDLALMLTNLGYSSICNVLAAIKAAKHWDLGPDDMIVTVATDGSELYNSERESIKRDT